MSDRSALSPLQKAVIGANSSVGIARGNNQTQLVSIWNCSKNAQTYAITIYDAPDITSAQSGAYPPLFQPIMSAGQVLDMTFLGRGLKLDYGLVAIPAGASNTDGGWAVVYL